MPPSGPAPVWGETPDTQEIRLAVTMTGGVSLAVWMAGVAREIDLLRQASVARRRSAQRDGTNPYDALISLLDVFVELDILSGTSAGGINAMMLAYARVREGDLGPLRELWLDMGALLDLLRDPADADVPSLLYGDRYLFDSLLDKLPTLVPGEPPAAPPSTTLYVTTTLLDAESGRFTDALGTQVKDSDRRGLFTFTEKQLGTAGIEGALALAARSSASFPAAFEPSFVPMSQPTAAGGGVPQRPAMGRYANITKDHWVADGGLLDNQPLDVILDRIFDRPARRPVRRVLLYVVPSADPSPGKGPVERLDDPYGLLDGLLKDLAATTSQSIGNDLRAISAHGDDVDARTDLRLQLADLAARLAPHRLLTGRLLSLWRDREAESQARLLTGALLRQLDTCTPQPAPASGVDADSVCRGAVRATLKKRWPSAVPTDVDGLAAYGRSAYDNAKSLALSVVQLAYDAADDEADRATCVAAKLEIHSAAPQPTRPDPSELASRACADPAAPGAAALPATAAGMAEEWADAAVVAPGEWLALGDAVRQHIDDLIRITQGTVDERLRTYTGYLRLGQGLDAQAIAVAMFDLTATERSLLPADVSPFQAVELVQVSADTCSGLAPRFATAVDKLTGMQFHHFGAFYKRSWRANDWMWGRLDAAGWLVQTLLDPRRLRLVTASVARGERAAWLLDRLTGLATGLETRLDRAAILDELRFLDADEPDLRPSLPRTSAWVATAWQHAIAREELPHLAEVILGTRSSGPVDASPANTRTWAADVLEDGADVDELLGRCPVPAETFTTDLGTQLMVHTVAKAAATTTAAVSSVQQIPGPVRPAITTAHTIALGGYRVANAVNGRARNLIVVGLVMLAIGISAAIPSSDLFGVVGIGVAAVGAYLLTFGVWQTSPRLLGALLSTTVTLAIGSLALPLVRQALFGSSGFVENHIHWFADAWWHPLVGVGIIAVVLVVVGFASSRTPRHRAYRR